MQPESGLSRFPPWAAPHLAGRPDSPLTSRESGRWAAAASAPESQRLCSCLPFRSDPGWEHWPSSHSRPGAGPRGPTPAEGVTPPKGGLGAGGG